MIQTLPFNDHVAEYEEWFQKYPYVFESEVQAIRSLMPSGENIRALEVASGTGRLSQALGIKEGIEPSANMRSLALKRGIEVLAGEAEHLVYKDLSFDLLLMSFCISYFENTGAAFKEAFRVLKKNGSLIVGFIEKDSLIGTYYEQRRPESIFYKNATFYSTKNVASELKRAGFKNLQYVQTLFKGLDEIKAVEPVKPGYGEGSFVVIKATK